MPVITNIADLQRIYKKRVPKMFHDYAESGSWDEQTLEDNSSDFKKIRLRQRVAVDMTDRKTNSEMIKQPVTIPVALAPVGLTGMPHTHTACTHVRDKRHAGRPAEGGPDKATAAE